MARITRRPDKTTKMVSYWPKGDYGDEHCFIRHISDEGAYVADAQKDDPSACIWLIPGTEQ